MKHPTRNLIGANLDLAVLVVQRFPHPGIVGGRAAWNLGPQLSGELPPLPIYFSPSTRWMDGGPLIDEAGITVGRIEAGLYGSDMGPPDYSWAATGLTNLMSAMRTLVLSKVGEEIELP